MRKNDFREAAINASYECAAFHKIEGEEIVWWYEENKKTRTKIPPQGGDYRAVDNFKARLKRVMEAAKPPYFDLQNQTEEEKSKWMTYLDKCLADIRAEFKADLSAATDIALEAGLKVDNFTRAFGNIFGQQPPVPIMTQALKETPPAQTVASSPAKIVKQVEEPKKSIKEALSEITELSQEAIALANDKNVAPYARILLFMEEVDRPVTLKEMKRAGLVGSDDGSVELDAKLFEMEQRGWMAFNFKTEFWQITSMGSDKLDDLEEEGALDPEPAHPSALEKIKDGLTEALAVARGEPNHAKFARIPVVPTGPGTVRAHVPDDAVKPKPTFTVVPNGPRVLKPVTRIQDLKGLTFVEKCMVALLDKDMAITELQGAIGHTSSWKSLANMLYTAEKSAGDQSGCIQFMYGCEKPSVYHLTDKGRAYIQRAIPAHKTLATS